MRSRMIGPSLLIAACLAVTGCTAAPSAAPEQTPTTGSTAEPADPAADIGPVPAFDSDCAAALSEEESAALLGEGTTLAAPESDAADASDDLGAERAAFDAAGGLRCTWASPEGTWLQIDVLPLQVVEASRVDAASPTACVATADGPPTCSVELAVGDAWLTVEAQTAATVNDALAPVGSRLGEQHPKPAKPLAGTWKATPCYATGQLVQLATGIAAEPVADPRDADPVRAVLAADGRLVRCSYAALGDGLDALGWEAVAGVAAADLDLAGLEPKQLDGFEAAWASADGKTLVVQAGDDTPDTARNTLVLRGDGAAAPTAMAKLADAIIATMPVRVDHAP